MNDARKPGSMSWQGFAEHRIREASEQGAFDNLPGQGQPLPGIEKPLHDDWWIQQKMKEEQISLVPPILMARKKKEQVLAEIQNLRHEADVRQRLEELNALIRSAMSSPAAGPPEGVQTVSIEACLEQWRAKRAV